jgi:hypothetical protein
VSFILLLKQDLYLQETFWEEKTKAKGFDLRVQLEWVFACSWLVGYTMRF